MINFFWLWKPDVFTLILALTIPGAFIAALSANKLLKNKDKKRTVLVLTCIMITIGPSLTILRIIDIEFSDVVEDHQKNTHARSEGLIISVNGLSGKILGGVGILLSGVLLSLAGFGEETSIEDKREAVTSLAIFSTSLLFVIAPISLFFISKYRINKSIHEDNLQDLGYETGNVKL